MVATRNFDLTPRPITSILRTSRERFFNRIACIFRRATLIHVAYGRKKERLEMADRKQFLGEVELDPRLKELLEKSRETPVTEEQLHEQRISFAFGNSLESENITKESVRKTSRTIRLAS